MSEWIVGTTLKEFIENNPSSADIQSMFFQILFSIELLNNTFGVIHNDLHLDNILLKKNSSSAMYNTLEISGKNYCTKNVGFYPVLWDFGFSYEKKGIKYHNLDTIKGLDHFNENSRIGTKERRFLNSRRPKITVPKIWVGTTASIRRSAVSFTASRAVNT